MVHTLSMKLLVALDILVLRLWQGISLAARRPSHLPYWRWVCTVNNDEMSNQMIINTFNGFWMCLTRWMSCGCWPRWLLSRVNRWDPKIEAHKQQLLSSKKIWPWNGRAFWTLWKQKTNTNMSCMEFYCISGNRFSAKQLEALDTQSASNRRQRVLDGSATSDDFNVFQKEVLGRQQVEWIT